MQGTWIKPYVFETVYHVVDITANYTAVGSTPGGALPSIL